MLTIEPMDEEDASNRTQRLKRLAFYENNGYQSLNHFYFEEIGRASCRERVSSPV